MHLLFAVLLLGHWLLASDLHVEPGAGGPAPAGYGSDTNWALFDSSIAQMRRTDPNPQVVILSGDFLAHRFPRNVPLAERTMTRIVRSFQAAFPRAQFLIVTGNNDDPCGDYRATPGSPYFRYIAHLWAPLVNRGGAAPLFERDFGQYGWYTARLPDGLRAIALDSVYWSVVYRRCANYHPDAPVRELRWLRERLQGSTPNTRALVVMHIPPGIDATSTLLARRLIVIPYWHAQFASAFVNVLSANAQRIAFAVAGHVHRNDFRLFGGVPLLVAPSISPVYNNNPAFLRLDVGSDGTLNDYVPYVYDELSNEWAAEESFDRVFGVRAFTGSEVQNAHARLGDDYDLRRRWGRMFVADADVDAVDASTWRTYWCAQTQLQATYASCAGLQRRLEIFPIAGGVAAAALLALLALLAVRLGRQRRVG